ncbi:MAG: hypothetical protein HQM08_26275 [Candidatus Riflebacteria bacterium]|nr:hypothetical protein [Candidatus Riflebacteria bacterium]
MLEVLVVAVIIVVLLLILYLTYRGVATGVQKGTELLATLQEESIFLAYLKHDLRTLIMGSDPGIPVPVVENDIVGTRRLTFYKVSNVDSTGRPLSVKVEYLRMESGKTETLADGRQVPLYSITRQVGLDNSHPFMNQIVASFAIEFLDKADQLLGSADFLRASKTRLTLRTSGAELLNVIASIYSPYLANTIASTPEDCWLPNYKIREFIPGVTRIITYQGIEIEPSKIEIIPGATGVVLKYNSP